MESIDKYIKEYSTEFCFSFSEHVSQEICGIKIEIDVMEYNDSHNHREKAHIVLQKSNLKYECDCVDIHNWDNMFFPVTLDNNTYLCFRKTLYGFTLLNIDTFEEFDYLPQKVLEGEESFIFVDAKSFGELIIFEGCYWGYTYSCYAYNHKQKRFLNLSTEYTLHSQDTAKISEDTLILTGTDENDADVTLKLLYDDICCRLTEKGENDF